MCAGAPPVQQARAAGHAYRGIGPGMPALESFAGVLRNRSSTGLLVDRSVGAGSSSVVARETVAGPTGSPTPETRIRGAESAMPRLIPAQLVYGSATVVVTTLAMLFLTQARSGAGTAVIAVVGLVAGVCVALAVPHLRAASASRAAARAGTTEGAGTAQSGTGREPARTAVPPSEDAEAPGSTEPAAGPLREQVTPGDPPARARREYSLRR